MSAQLLPLPIDPTRHYTVEEYFALANASPIRLEFDHGRIYPHPDDADREAPTGMAGGTKSHNRVIGNVAFVLNGALRAAGSACEVFTDSLRVQVDASGRYTYPDLVISCDDRDDDPLTIRQPSVLVEVLSPGTKNYDCTEKFDDYRAIPSLDQIVFIEPRWVMVDSYTRNPDGATWTLTALRTLSAELLIRSVDVRIPLAEIYRRIQLSDLRAAEETGIYVPAKRD